MLSFFSIVLCFFLPTGLSQDHGPWVQTSDSGSGVQWLTFEEALERNCSEPRKIIVDLYTDWCGWCKRMDKKTYSSPDIYEYINENFYPVKFNGESQGDVKFQGKTYRFIPTGKRGYHQLAAFLVNGQLSYPTTVFLGEDNRVIQPISGYLNPRLFRLVMHYFGEDKYRDTSWETFKNNKGASK